ncbi:Nicotianamine synthase [Pyrenochaeta sp. MPI-SDFR-AT-0127]|nr:Nicotianamine synthase [Pyrenochaeta sp. MPI-SDFR-AT-0127]
MASPLRHIPGIEASKTFRQEASSTSITPPTTPNPTRTSAHELLAEIQKIHSSLAACSSLAPGDEINTLLTYLVNLCIKSYSVEFTSYFFSIPGIEDLCQKLRPLCSESEGELESFWAKRMTEATSESIGTSQSNRSILATFPYHQNYIDLSRLECSTLEAFLPSTPTQIAFVGSGPLPLTSLCILDRYPNVKAHNIDRDSNALVTSQKLCGNLGYGERMTYGCEDVSLETGSSTAWKSFEVVFLAALVGTDTNSKVSILSSICKKLSPGALIVARSARGLRSVLYPILELSDDLDRIGLEVLAEVHPWTQVVNSVIVLRVK